MKQDLQRVREWALDKCQGGSEPPWAWYQYMKLIDAADAILKGMEAVTTESSPQSERHSGTHLRLVDATYQRDSAQHHSSEPEVTLPM